MSNGIFYGVKAEDYHKVEALSASGAKLLLRSPAHYRAQREKPKAPTAAMLMGTIVHGLVLEPATFSQDIAVAPKFDRRTSFGKKAAEEFAADNEGKMIIDQDSYDRARNIADAVMACPLAAEEFRDGHSEVTLFWDEHGVRCKSRLDYLRGGSIIDLKTCTDASPDGFARQVANLQYHVQAAHYLAGYRETVGWDADRFVFVAVENDAPYSVGVYTLDPLALQTGRILIKRAASAYKTALELDDWRSYQQEIIELALPGWATINPDFGGAAA